MHNIAHAETKAVESARAADRGRLFPEPGSSENRDTFNADGVLCGVHCDPETPAEADQQSTAKWSHGQSSRCSGTAPEQDR